MIEENLGYYFFDKNLLKRALTRPAYAAEQSPPCDHQAAYSLLGSGVLDTVLTELLIRAGYTCQPELISKKLELKQTENLAKISQRVGLGYLAKFSTAEKQRQVYEQPEALVETLEAVIGSIYFDGGFSAARRAVQQLFNDVFAQE